MIYDKAQGAFLAQLSLPIRQIDFMDEQSDTIIFQSKQEMSAAKLVVLSETDYKLEMLRTKQLSFTPEHVISVRNRMYLVSKQAGILATLDPFTFELVEEKFGQKFSAIAYFNKTLIYNTDNVLNVYNLKDARIRSFFTLNQPLKALQSSKNILVVSTTTANFVFNSGHEIVCTLKSQNVPDAIMVFPMAASTIVVLGQAMQLQFYEIQNTDIDPPKAQEGKAEEPKKDVRKALDYFCSLRLTQPIDKLDLSLQAKGEEKTLALTLIQRAELIPIISHITHSLQGEKYINQQSFQAIQVKQVATQQPKSHVAISRQLSIMEAASDQINILEQALRIEDVGQVRDVVKEQNFGLYKTLPKSLKAMFVKLLLENFTPAAMKWLVTLKEEPEVQAQRDEIYARLMQLKELEPGLKEIAQTQNAKGAGELEPEVIIEAW